MVTCWASTSDRSTYAPASASEAQKRFRACSRCMGRHNTHKPRWPWDCCTKFNATLVALGRRHARLTPCMQPGRAPTRAMCWTSLRQVACAWSAPHLPAEGLSIVHIHQQCPGRPCRVRADSLSALGPGCLQDCGTQHSTQHCSARTAGLGMWQPHQMVCCRVLHVAACWCLQELPVERSPSKHAHCSHQRPHQVLW
jgi:hypothetical protein